MNKELYQLYIEATMKHCLNTLTTKANEYTKTGDMLHNFEVAAVLQGINREQALTGMLAKHTVSLNDMAPNAQHYAKDAWLEKICDSINYLLILSAMIRENSED